MVEKEGPTPVDLNIAPHNKMTEKEHRLIDRKRWGWEYIYRSRHLLDRKNTPRSDAVLSSLWRPNTLHTLAPRKSTWGGGKMLSESATKYGMYRSVGRLNGSQAPLRVAVSPLNDINYIGGLRHEHPLVSINVFFSMCIDEDCFDVGIGDSMPLTVYSGRTPATVFGRAGFGRYAIQSGCSTITTPRGPSEHGAKL